MKTNIEALANLRRQRGKVIEIILAIAIIGVLVLMWQSGSFTSNSSSPTTLTNPATAVPMPESDPEIAQDNESVLPAAAEGKQLEPIVRTASGKEPESINALADRLIRDHPLDISACEKESNPTAALSCANIAQSSALEAIFADYKALIDQGEQTATARGGEVIKRVTQALQAKIQKFEDAVK